MCSERVRLALGVVALALASCRAPASVELAHPTAPGDGPRVLCVTAHPDDEIAFAGVLYKNATLLHGRCDLAVITNGEGGFKYATLAEPLYGLELTDEEVGRAHLPAIRREELLSGCRLLGVHEVFFLNEWDHRYTQDVEEVLGADDPAWDVERVETRLEEILRAGRYDFLLLLTPTAETHGHHKAASILALRARERLPHEERPAALTVLGWREDAPAPSYREPLPGYPLTRPESDARYVFDRRQRFGFRGRLDYRIVANWAIAEHRSQGTMQLLANQGAEEHYFLLAGGPPNARERAARFFEALAGEQFETKTYGASAGTNATAR